MAKINSCMYCGARAFGPGCPFSPHGVHVHPSDPKRCIYCGSFAMGPGCPFNPFSKVHVHGVEFNTMIRDSVQNTITSGYLINKLTEPIENTPAYKMGLIDENGKKIKNVETLEEKAAFGPIDEYVLMLKQMLGNKVDIANSAICLNRQEEIEFGDYAKICESELKIKDQIESSVNDFFNVIAEGYQQGLSTGTIEKLMLEVFIDRLKK